jgi:lipopolysaccharide transport system permease protein
MRFSEREAERGQRLTVMKPPAMRPSLGLSEVWEYRELLSFLIWRDIKIRYKQTALGVLWAVLQPALTTLIFALIFSRVSQFSSSDTPYILFVLSGLLVWLFIFNGVGFGANSLLVNVSLITKIYFPRVIIPVSAVLAGTLDLLIGLVIFFAVSVFWGIFPTFWTLLAPLFLLQTLLLTMSLGVILSALNVRFRDVKFAIPLMLQIWMVLSPVFYPTNIVPESIRPFTALNPVVGIVEGFRATLFGGPFDVHAIGVSVAVTFCLFVISLYVFRQMEDSFADLI